MTKLDAKSIIEYIGNAPKKTPVKVFIKGEIDQLDFLKKLRTLPKKILV